MASAVAGNGKATLIGRRTFGKGVIQTEFQLTGGAKLHLTTERYLTPEKKNINGVGLKPQVYVKSTAQNPDPTKDPFVIRAWGYINKR